MNKFFIGLILGIALAGGLAVYLNNTPMQFALRGVNSTPNNVSNSSAPMILAPGTKLQAAKQPAAYTNKELSSEPDNNAASAPSYQFYDVLQDESAQSHNHNTTNPTSQPLPQTLEFMVQAGAFATSDAANDMQARLALLGISSQIKAEQNNNKVINRVLIGPIVTESEAQQIINRLSDERINALLLRITD